MPENIENDLDGYWDSVRNRKSDHSFPAVADWIREMHKSAVKSRLEKSKRRTITRWIALSTLPLFFILSCTIRVERVEKSGSLVNFSIDKKEDSSFQKLSSLQQEFTFTCYEFLQKDQPTAAIFIFFIPENEQVKLSLITQQLKNLNGLRKLDINSIHYTIRETLFSTFLHKTLRLGKNPGPKAEELTRNIEATLKGSGLYFVSVTVSNDKDRHISFVSDKQNSESLTINNKDSSAMTGKMKPGDKVPNTPAVISKLQIFNWLLGSWEVKYVPRRTYHYWLKVNDSLLMCFVIKYADQEQISYGDDGPDISVGFSIRYSSSNSTILSLRGIEWKFVSANDKEVLFKNEITPKSANVKWSLNKDQKSWQSVISGERNLEIVNLTRDENVKLENIVKEFISKHENVMKRTYD